MEENDVRPKMYVWRGKGDYLAVAIASSIAESRNMVLQEISKVGCESMPVCGRAIKDVQENTPIIFLRSNAEFVLSNSGELEELFEQSEDQRKEILSLKEETTRLRLEIDNLRRDQ